MAFTFRSKKVPHHLPVNFPLHWWDQLEREGRGINPSRFGEFPAASHRIHGVLGSGFQQAKEVSLLLAREPPSVRTRRKVVAVTAAPHFHAIKTRRQANLLGDLPSQSFLGRLAFAHAALGELPAFGEIGTPRHENFPVRPLQDGGHVLPVAFAHADWMLLGHAVRGKRGVNCQNTRRS